MIETGHILTIAFINVCLAQLAEMQKRCGKESWMGIIVRYATVELLETRSAILDRSFYPENKDHIDREYFSLVCELKPQMYPVDYLFLKSLFTKDDRDREFLLQQAQMMVPENLRFHLMSTFLNPDAEQCPEAVIRHLNSLVGPSDTAEVVEYTRLVTLIWKLFNDASDIGPAEIARFLRNSSLHHKAQSSLLYHIARGIPAAAGSELLDRMEESGMEESREFLLARLHVSYELGELRRAEQLLLRLNEAGWIVELELRMEWVYKRSVMLRETGREGEAILLLMSLLISEDFDDCGSDYYFHAIADLAGYFVRTLQPEAADRVLALVSDDMMPYVEALAGEDFLLTLAEKAMLEVDYKTALQFYEKAYLENRSPEIQKKIKKIKKLV